ncbi:MAG: hypothetical protein Q8P02_02145, partial [Candidatus Micrarchaeota archaeon]|nr:hypothetical protein [Candidatus Micrarchaeota archaeon]
QVVITYKPVHYTGKLAGEDRLVITLQPDESFALTVNLKEPGETQLKSFTMDYCQSCEVRPFAPQAYEILFEEALLGKKTFFASWPEIEAGWKFVETVRKNASGKPEPYAAGTLGPASAGTITQWKPYLGKSAQ